MKDDFFENLKHQPTLEVMMVCMGNICRSPTAEEVLRHRLAQVGLGERVRVSSSGTHGYHVGAPADVRSARHAQRRGYDLSGHRAQQLLASHFSRCDLLLTMDHDNHERALAACPSDKRHKVHLLMSLVDPVSPRAVPDPYHGGDAGFEAVLDMVEMASDRLIARLQAEWLPGCV